MYLYYLVHIVKNFLLYIMFLSLIGCSSNILKSKNNLLKIGDWKINKCHLILFNLSHVNTALTQHNANKVHGIIGADILLKGKAFIDYSNKTLYLKRVKK